MNLSLKHLFAVIFILFTIPAPAQEKAERKVEKDFSPAPGKVEVESKFGNVEILAWDQNKIQVNAHILVKSKNKDKAESLLEKMDVEIRQEGDVLIVKSLFGSRISSGGDTDFRINFTIQAPTEINLDLDSKYGSAYIEKVSGIVNIDLAHGNLKAYEFTRGKDKPLNQINLAYSSANLSNAGWLKTDLSYSKLSVLEADALVILSKYSGVSIDECSSLVSESKYDSYKINKINNYSGELKFSNLSAQEIFKKFEVKSEYSTVKVDQIGNEFTSISIDNTRGVYKLGIDKDASFTLNAEAHRGNVIINGMEKVDKKVENTDKYFTGTHGNNPQSTVNIKTNDGTIKIEVD